MPIITDTEVLATLIENDTGKTPGMNLYGEPSIVCPGCTREIDPTTCHCGTERERHDSWNDGHSFVPMGCICGYDKSPRVETVRELTETTDLPWDL